MSVQLVAIVRVLAILIALQSLAPVSVAAQPSSSAATSVPRTPDGRPDLQGVWDFGSVTPLQRPAALAGKVFLTEEDVSALEAQAAARVDRPPRPGDPGTYNRFWFADGTKVVGTRRTSLIVDPPDGQLPSYTPEGKARMAVREEARRRNAGQRTATWTSGASSGSIPDRRCCLARTITLGSSHKCVHDSAQAGRPRRGKRLRMCSCRLTSAEVVCRSVDGRLRGPRFWWGTCSAAAGLTARY